MKLGIISPADDNLYAGALLASLTAAGDTPCLVISTHRPRLARAVAYAQHNGWRALIGRMLEEADLAPASPASVRRYLQEMAATRGLRDWDRPLSQSCRAMGVEYLHVPSVNAPAAVEAVRRHGVDVLLSAVAELYRPPMIQAPAIGILNAHMASLPTFRGMNVLEWSVLLGHPIGVTIHFVAERVDTGAILLHREIPVTAGDTLDSLRAQSMALNVELMLEAVGRLKAGQRVDRPGTIDEKNPPGPPLGRGGSTECGVGRGGSSESGLGRGGSGGFGGGGSLGLPEGRQYFVMHARLKEIVRQKVVQKISTGSVSTGR